MMMMMMKVTSWTTVRLNNRYQAFRSYVYVRGEFDHDVVLSKIQATKPAAPSYPA
jgi:hypothetical protein